MTRSIDLFIANPAGNITIMVTSPTIRHEYKSLAASLLDIDFSKDCGISFPGYEDSLMGEQVSYIKSTSFLGNSLPEMEMCGLEFCGNASRTFAYYIADCYLRADAPASDAVQKLSDGNYMVKIKVSGWNHPLVANVNLEKHTSTIEMPLPSDITTISLPADIIHNGCTELRASLVKMDGISHLIVSGMTASVPLFEKIKTYYYENIDSHTPALGVMFVDKKNNLMTPVVYVRDVDTRYFEGSCASGTTAAACAFATDSPDGNYEYCFSQPSGSLSAKLSKRFGRIESLSLSGTLEISEHFTIDI